MQCPACSFTQEILVYGYTQSHQSRVIVFNHLQRCSVCYKFGWDFAQIFPEPKLALAQITRLDQPPLSNCRNDPTNTLAYNHTINCPICHEKAAEIITVSLLQIVENASDNEIVLRILKRLLTYPEISKYLGVQDISCQERLNPSQARQEQHSAKTTLENTRHLVNCIACTNEIKRNTPKPGSTIQSNIKHIIREFWPGMAQI